MAVRSVPPLLVLDLDGTLVDSGPDLIAALNAVMGADGFGEVPAEAVGKLVGRGARAMVQRALQFHEFDGSESHVDRLVESFVDHYRQHIADRSQPFPGARDCLERFRGAGWSLAVCTNKREDLAVQLLEELDLLACMSAVCGGDTFAVSKPDPRHLTGTIMRAGGDPESSVMVGDSETDIVTAKAAEVPIVAVTFGYSDDPLDQFGPDALVTSFDDVFSAANRLLSVEDVLSRSV